MPCIVMYTNMEVPKEKAEELKKALVVSWEKLPGKSERWLITTIRDNTTMFFGGKDTPAAFVNFKILGTWQGELRDPERGVPDRCQPGAGYSEGADLCGSR